MRARVFYSLPLVFLLIYALEAAVSVYLQTHISRFEDVVTPISLAQRILRGEVLYRDIITAIMPVFLYLRMPAVLIAQYTGLNVMAVSIATENILALASIALTLRILKNVPHFSALSLYGIGAVLGAILFVLPYYDNIMGQQEYFFWLFSLPYFTLAAARAERIIPSVRFRLFIGAFAVIGFCYKPFYVIPLLLVEAYLCLIARSPRSLFRAESLTCGVLGVAYLLWTLFGMHYFGTILYLASFYYEWHFDALTIAFYFSQKLLQFLVPALILLVYTLRRPMPLRRFLLVYLLALWGCAIAAIGQLKATGYDYHLYPTIAMTLLACTVALIALKQQAHSQERNIAFLLVAAALAGLTLYCSDITFRQVRKEAWLKEHSTMILDHIAELQKQFPSAAGGVYKFGTLLNPVFPDGFTERGMEWNYQFYDQWLLWGVTFYKLHHRDEPEAQVTAHTQVAETLLNHAMAEDFARLKPGVVLQPIDKIDYVTYYSQYAPFAQQMKNYAFYENYDGYKLFLRQP